MGKRHRRKSRKTAIPAKPDHVGPTQEMKDKPGVRKGGGGIHQNAVQIPLDAYLHKNPGGINIAQHAAGERLYETFKYAGFDSCGRSFLDRLNDGYAGNVSSWRSAGYNDHQIDCLHAIIRAMEAIKGDIGRRLVRAVVLEGFWLRDLEEPNYPRVSELMARFREALDDLIDFYHTPIPSELRGQYDTRRNNMAKNHAYPLRTSARANPGVHTITVTIDILRPISDRSDRQRYKVECEKYLRNWGESRIVDLLLVGDPVITFDEPHQTARIIELRAVKAQWRSNLSPTALEAFNAK